ncbi:MAG: c-type cytochrome [Betaproteobacteria bacterium]
MPHALWAALPCLLISFSPLAAETPKQLAARHLCFGCHAVDEVRAGPSYQQVAERYATRPDAVTYLLGEVRKGSVGKWGSTPMPPEIAPDPDLKQIIEWVMQQ